jgi:hypothetical protein
MDLHVTLGPLASSLKALSSSDGLERPRSLAANYANRQPRFPEADLPSSNLLIKLLDIETQRFFNKPLLKKSNKITYI